MTGYLPPDDEPGGRRHADAVPSQPGMPLLSGGFPRPDYGPDYGPDFGPDYAWADSIDTPELVEVADQVREALQGHRLRPAARDELRARLMAAAADQLAPQPERRRLRRPAADTPASGHREPPVTIGDAAPASPGSHRMDPPTRRTGRRRPPRDPQLGRGAAGPGRRRTGRPVPVLGWSMVGAAVALAATLVAVRTVPDMQDLLGVEPVAAIPGNLDRVSADPREGLAVGFSQPMNQASVNAALRLSPAAAVTTSWQGRTLIVTPVHGFAPNAAYVLTIDHTVARTAAGKAPGSNITVAFGTAPAAGPAVAVGSPAHLSRTELTTAQAGSEAVVTQQGSILVTAHRSAGGTGPAELVRFTGSTQDRLAAATKAICISRSGRSTAYLVGGPGNTRIAMADSAGAMSQQVSATVDPKTPLGWINDDEVIFVSGGKLRALDRSRRIRTLLPTPVHPGDTLVLAPGGRYAYLAPEGKPGNVIDLATGRSHALPAAVGNPTFAADGSTVYWVQDRAGIIHLNSAPSGDGPIMSVPLPDLRSGDQVSDLSVSPDGTQLAYSVTRADRHAELRVATLPTLATVAVSKSGSGRSPNWAPGGQMFTVLGTGANGPEIQTVQAPGGSAVVTSAMDGVAQAFTNAQINGDPGAQQAIAPGVTLPVLQRVTRGGVISVLQSDSGTATAIVRLSTDPTVADPVNRQATETLTLHAPSGGGLPRVTAVSVTPFAPAPDGPQLTRVDTRSVPGAVRLTFDSDLNPVTVPSAVDLLSSGGSNVAATTSYDPGTRTVTVRPAMAGSLGTGSALVVVSTALSDIAGTPATTEQTIPVHLQTPSS
jgi:hypothetical protein